MFVTRMRKGALRKDWDLACWKVLEKDKRGAELDLFTI